MSKLLFAKAALASFALSIGADDSSPSKQMQITAESERHHISQIVMALSDSSKTNAEYFEGGCKISKDRLTAECARPKVTWPQYAQVFDKSGGWRVACYERDRLTWPGDKK